MSGGSNSYRRSSEAMRSGRVAPGIRHYASSAPRLRSRESRSASSSRRVSLRGRGHPLIKSRRIRYLRRRGHSAHFRSRSALSESTSRNGAGVSYCQCLKRSLLRSSSSRLRSRDLSAIRRCTCSSPGGPAHGRSSNPTWALSCFQPLYCGSA